MAASADGRFPTSRVRFANLPNFRVLCAKHISSTNALEGMLFRSSRPDFLDSEEVSTMKNLGIKSILDFRSSSEYTRANGSKLLDEDYCLCEIRFPQGRKYRCHEGIKLKAVKAESMLSTVLKLMGRTLIRFGRERASDDDSNADGTRENAFSPQNVPYRHILINFFPSDYVQTVFARAPVYIRLYALFIGLIDVVLNNGFLYFLRVFATYILNPTGLIGQYKDITQLSHRSICAALRLMTDPQNLPMLINCAHGKDRTGIIAALVLTCLGKPKEYICTEYALSQAGTKEIYSRMEQEVVKRFRMSEEFLTASYTTMETLLDFLTENYGSVEDYMESIGFSRQEQATLRLVLTGTEHPLS